MPLFPMTSNVTDYATVPEPTWEEPKTSSPVLRPPASIQVKNRRKRYLDRHPEYFSSDLEMAGPHLPPYRSLSNLLISENAIRSFY
jgi:hypothetical protein